MNILTRIPSALTLWERRPRSAIRSVVSTTPDRSDRHDYSRSTPGRLSSGLAHISEIRIHGRAGFEGSLPLENYIWLNYLPTMWPLSYVMGYLPNREPGYSAAQTFQGILPQHRKAYISYPINPVSNQTASLPAPKNGCYRGGQNSRKLLQ